jgi:LPXTG-site transpeptidase (sortase) family protein
MSKSPERNNKLLLGIGLIVIGILFLFVKTPSETPYEVGSFQTEPVEIKGFEEGDVDKERIPVKIIIPDLKINIDIEESQIVNGYWDVHENTAGWGEGSGLPGENGNQVIFAHAKENLFLPLDDAVLGMRVYIFTKDGWYEYKIDSIKEVYPNQTEVIEPTEDETLTLYTCSGFNDSRRLIVGAKRD